jgi:molybdopterin converting factor small subunit
LSIESPALRVFTVNGQFERDRNRVLAADDELTAVPPVGGG